MQHNVFTDTMQSGNTYRSMKRYFQVYSTEFGWSRAHPMKNKVDAYETLSLFSKRDGVAHKILIGVSKEHTI